MYGSEILKLKSCNKDVEFLSVQLFKLNFPKG